MNNINVIEEKFTRCPQCRSFSVRVSTELTTMEKIKAKFLAVTVFQCDNCGYRFAVFGTLSDLAKKLLIAVPLLLIVVAVGLFFLLSSDNSNGKKTPEPVIRTQHEHRAQIDLKKPATTAIKPVKEPPLEPKETPKETVEPPKTAGPAVTADIILGNSDRFGSNWSPVAGGVKITRLSNGPLKSAGIKVGDILTEVAGEKVGTGDSLLKIRGEIFSGHREDALIKVIRNNQAIYFRLIKNKKEKLQAPPQALEKKIEKPKEALATKPAEVLPVSVKGQTYKIASATIIKIRNSAPDTEGGASRWVYYKTMVVVQRQEGQRVYVAGDVSGSKRWGVDNLLRIKGEVFEGTTSPVTKAGVWLPEEIKIAPIDITELVPAGKPVRLPVELIDNGKMWGNTDIYIVIK